MGYIPGEHENADRRSLAQHRNAETGLVSAVAVRLGKSVLRIGFEVGNMNHFTFEQDPPENRTAFRFNRNPLDAIHELDRESMGRRTIEHLTFLSGNNASVGIAKAGGRLNAGLKHRLQIERRAANNFKDVGSGGLLLQRLSQLVEQPRILNGNDCLGQRSSGAAQSASR